MAAESEDITAVKEWLVSEVKLERYADKLVSNGFISLEICCSINETVLDEIGIILPYHRRRFLTFVEKLREKLGVNLPNEENGVMSNVDLKSHGSEAGNEQQTSLIRLDNEHEKREPESGASVSFVKEDGENSESVHVEEEVPVLPPKAKAAKRTPSGKAPPPIPPRADLQEGTVPSDTSLKTEHLDTHPHDVVQSSQAEKASLQPELPKKKVPVKPPRRTINKVPAENKPEATPSSSIQTGAQADPQQQGPVSVSNDIMATFDPLKSAESPVDFNSTSAISDLPQHQVVGEDSKTSGDHDISKSAIYGNIEDVASHPAAQIERKRSAPKAPARVGSKKPVPAPRGRVKSEDGVLVTALVPDRNTVDGENGETSSVLNHTFQPRTKSFSTPGNKRILSASEEKPSTLPRYPARAAPPPPPSRQTGSSLKDKRVFTEMPLPPIPPEDGNEIHHDQLDGACQQGSAQGACSPDIRQPEPAGEYVLVQQSTSESSIYESIGTSNDQKEEDPGDADYSSDDSLDGLVDLPDFGPKISRSDSVDSVDDNRMSKNILSPRVRKRDGFLWKQGGQQNNKGWRKRWFVFDGNDLKYYKDKHNLNESLHIIPVSQIKDVEHIKDAKRPTFKVVTPNRTFILASESTTEMNLWSQTLMEAILTYKGDHNAWKSGGDMCDPEKEGWLKKQGHNVVADWKKRYVAVKDDKICYYDTYDDFVYATPINCINAALAKVKTVEGHKNRFTIITFNKSYSFQGDSEIDSASWIIAIETAIQIGLGDRAVRNMVKAVLEKVWENPSNRKCADCGMKDPVWASVNFCVCICAKCVGIHRHLGVHCSRARSLLMDEKIWNPTLIELMIKIGNDSANKLLEHMLPEDDKITPQADFSARHEFIYSKYKEKKYCKYHQAFGDNNILGQSLRETVVTDDFLTTMTLILNKVDVCFLPSDAEDEKTPLELAEEAGQMLQAELLRQNGGEGGQLALQINDDQVSPETSQGIPVVEVVYEKQGFLYKKDGGWRKRWFLLKDRDLKYARGPHEKEDLVTIDLRTVTSLVKCPKGETLQMDIVTVDKTHSVKAETEGELEEWYSALRNKQVFGVLLCNQDLGSDGIPHLVAKCLQFVETYGGLEMEGVYRVNGGQLTMKKLKASFDQDAGTVLLTVDECGVHDVTGVLKQYLRQLPDPVIPSSMYRLFIEAGMIQDHGTRLTTIKDLINKLPKVNHDTLKEIIFHLTKVVGFVSVNKMGVPNIAMIFGPTLMSNENTGRMDDSSINQEFSIVGDMINYYQWLFDVDNEEFEKDKAIQIAKQKIRQLQEQQLRVEKTDSAGGEFTLDIYVKEKNDKPCRLKVSSEMTAGRVCAEIVAQMKLPPDTDWVLFEVIDNGAMERAFQVREKVLAAANWGSGNHLIIKENCIAEQIAPYVGGLSMEGTLHIREPKKNWKQTQVWLKNGYLSVNKERGVTKALISKAIKSDKSEAEQWPLHKLTLYVGVPSEKATKGVDTSCGFTVIVKTDQEDIIRYMCVKDKREMNRWVAAILNMKHPEGIWSDPSQREAMATYSLVEPRGQQTDDLPVYLGRQSMILRRKGSSKHIMDELKVKQKSLRRSTARDPEK